MVRLVVHLGAAKSGSSALQHYFAKNRAALRANGVLIPDQDMAAGSNVSGTQLWFFESLRPCGADQQKIFHDRLARLRETADAEGLNTVVISSENLINPRGFHRLFEKVDQSFDLRCLLYVRRQDDYLISAWHQWDMKRGDSPDQLFAKRAEFGDWHDRLLPWEETVGRDRITVRRFGKSYLTDGDVVSDFVSAIALNTDGCEPLAGFTNRSLDEALGRMASRVPDVFTGPHDNGFYEAFANVLGEEAFKRGNGSALFSYGQRLQILDTHAPGNDALKKKYFPDLPAGEPLFQPPDPEEAITLTPAEERDEELRFLIRAVYRMAEKIQALERAQPPLPAAAREEA